MEYLFIYLLQLLDLLTDVNIIFFIIFVFSGVFLIILGFLTRFTYEKFKSGDYYDITEDTAIHGTRIAKKLCLVSFCLAILLSFIPTKQTLLLMGGTYLGKKAVNSVVTDEKIKKIDTIINLEFDKRVKELQKEVK